MLLSPTCLWKRVTNLEILSLIKYVFKIYYFDRLNQTLIIMLLTMFQYFKYMTRDLKFVDVCLLNTYCVHLSNILYGSAETTYQKVLIGNDENFCTSGELHYLANPYFKKRKYPQNINFTV